MFHPRMIWGWGEIWGVRSSFKTMFNQREKKGLRTRPLCPFKGSHLRVHSSTWLPPTWGAIETNNHRAARRPFLRENSPWRAELAPRGNGPEKEEMARGSYTLALPIEAIYHGRQQNAANGLQINTHFTKGWPAPVQICNWLPRNIIWAQNFSLLSFQL